MKAQGKGIRRDDARGFGAKGPRATAVHRAGAAAAQPRRRDPTRAQRRTRAGRSSAPAGSLWWLAWPLMAGYGALLAAAVWSKAAPWWVVPASAGLSLSAFFAYWQDKDAAEQGRWRTPENILHLWSLAGGWPGAWFAQQVLRHKSRKASFLLRYWLTVTAHLGAVGGWLWWAARA